MYFCLYIKWICRKVFNLFFHTVSNFNLTRLSGSGDETRGKADVSLAFSNSSFKANTKEMNREHSTRNNTSHKKESVRFSEILITTYQPTRRHIPGERVIHNQRNENLYFHNVHSLCRERICLFVLLSKQMLCSLIRFIINDEIERKGLRDEAVLAYFKPLSDHLQKCTFITI
jgi:hypothetical protein